MAEGKRPAGGDPAPGSRRRVLVITHEPTAPAGLLGDWLDDRGAAWDELAIYRDGADVAPADYDFIVSLGYEGAAYDDSLPWLATEIELLRAAAAADVPILGICFGGQLLARVLGGRCFPAPRAEIGWLPVRSDDPELVPEGPWFQWHYDAFEPPPGARIVARTDAAIHAFVAGRNLGLQFHPEVTADIVAAWVGPSHEVLARYGIDAAELLAETPARVQAAARPARALFDAFITRVARLQLSPSPSAGNPQAPPDPVSADRGPRTGR